MIIRKDVINDKLVVSLDDTKLVFDMIDEELYYNGQLVVVGTSISRLLSDNFIDVSKYSKSLRQAIENSIASIKDSLKTIALHKTLSEIEEG